MHMGADKSKDLEAHVTNVAILTREDVDGFFTVGEVFKQGVQNIAHKTVKSFLPWFLNVI